MRVRITWGGGGIVSFHTYFNTKYINPEKCAGNKPSSFYFKSNRYIIWFDIPWNILPGWGGGGGSCSPLIAPSDLIFWEINNDLGSAMSIHKSWIKMLLILWVVGIYCPWGPPNPLLWENDQELAFLPKIFVFSAKNWSRKTKQDLLPLQLTSNLTWSNWLWYWLSSPLSGGISCPCEGLAGITYWDWEWYCVLKSVSWANARWACCSNLFNLSFISLANKDDWSA